MTQTPIPWPPVPDCCAQQLRVLLRDRVGAELECVVCRHVRVVWFTPAQTALIDSAIATNCVDGR